MSTNNPDRGLSSESYRYSYIFMGKLKTTAYWADFGFGPQLTSDTVVHELGHQFVNTLINTGHNHDAGVMNHSGNDQCVMDYQSWPADWIIEFCFDGPNHIYDIRKEADPLN